MSGSARCLSLHPTSVLLLRPEPDLRAHRTIEASLIFVLVFSYRNQHFDSFVHTTPAQSFAIALTPASFLPLDRRTAVRSLSLAAVLVADIALRKAKVSVGVVDQCCGSHHSFAEGKHPSHCLAALTGKRTDRIPRARQIVEHTLPVLQVRCQSHPRGRPAEGPYLLCLLSRTQSFIQQLSNS